MSSYIVLARKWRPAQFSDIVGQSHVVRTMMNAIRADRVHHAYLMTGSRGIGKTSIARIFAKALRCPDATWTSDGILQSCDQCSSCKEIATSSSVDVIEIDGASNNGVDAVREIRENAKFLPSSGARKIYIIDEVHMLSTAAFNALLKTLEEPPSHVIFIFATTEPHKIPGTILSRTQRFDLKRVSPGDIQARLAFVLSQEGVPFETGALALIARAAEGGMRDALSLLDQALVFSAGSVTTEATRECIGLMSSQLVLDILSAVLSGDIKATLAKVDVAHQQGHDLRLLARSLLELLHSVLLAKVGANQPASTELSPAEWGEIQGLAQKRNLNELELMFQILHYGMDGLARAAQPKIILDVLLIKAAHVYGVTSAPQTLQTPPVPPQQRPAPVAVPLVQSTAPAPSAPVAQPPIQSVTLTWEGFVSHVKKGRPLLASILENGTARLLPSSENDELQIVFNPDDSYYRDQIQTRVYAEQLLTFGKEYFGRQIRIRSDLQSIGETLAGRKERELKEKSEAAKRAVANHPIITEARSLFGGELSPVELIDADPSDESTDRGGNR